MMMKKSWKNRKGVSPVIATILMVAITVVLAAVLYVMVMGFGGQGGQNPTASLTKSTTAVAHQEKILIASISEAQIASNIKFSVITTISGTTATYVGTNSVTGTTITTTWAPVLASTTSITAISFVDVGADGKVSAGDYFLVTAHDASSSVTLSLLYGTSSASIASAEWTSN